MIEENLHDNSATMTQQHRDLQVTT